MYEELRVVAAGDECASRGDIALAKEEVYLGCGHVVFYPRWDGSKGRHPTSRYYAGQLLLRRARGATYRQW